METFFSELIESVNRYLEITPFEVLARNIIFTIGGFLIFCVVIWGLLELWLDARQGLYVSKLKWNLLRVNVPGDAIQTPKGMENFFTSLAGIKSTPTWKEKWLDGKIQGWFSFEIASLGGEVRFYIRTVTKYRDMVEAAFYAQYPEAQISEVDEDYVDVVPKEFPNENWDLWGSEVKLANADYLPIRTWDSFEHTGEKDQRFKDPLLSLLEGIGRMQPGEYYFMQLLIYPIMDDDWLKKGEKEINRLYGKEEKKKSGNGIADVISWLPAEIVEQVTGGSLTGSASEEKKADDFAAFKITPREKEKIDGIANKISKIGWYTKIRFYYAAQKPIFRKGTIASMTKGIWNQYGHLNLNKLGLHAPATPNDDYFWQEWELPGRQRNLVNRFKARSFGTGASPYILNVEELATIFHFPAADARTPVLTSLGARRSEAPNELQFAGVDEPDLPNLNRTSPDVQGGYGASSLPQAKPLVAPHPTAPTSTRTTQVQSRPVQVPAPAHVPEEFIDPSMPRPGMPAPLPPGLDLADEPINNEEIPRNLPL